MSLSVQSPRIIENSQNLIIENNTSRESQSDLIRYGELIRKNCCSYRILSKGSLLSSLNGNTDNQIGLEKNLEDEILMQEQNKQKIKQSKETSIQLSINYVGVEEVLTPSGSNQQNIKEIIHNKLENTLSSPKESLINDEIKQKAEKKSILQNSRYENYISLKASHPKTKINSLIQALNLVVIVASFLESIKQFGQQYKFKRLKEADFSIIGDKASHYPYFFEKEYFLGDIPSRSHRCFLKLLLMIEKNPILKKLKKNVIQNIDWKATIIIPNQPIKICWDIFIFLLLSLNIFYIPIKITWEDSGKGGYILSEWMRIFLNDLPGWAFLIDIVLNFNTAFYDQGIIICQRKKIISYYLKTKFISDLIVVIPFIISLRLKVTLLNAVLLLRTNKMFKMAQYFEQLVNLRRRQEALYNLCKLVFMIVFVAHFCGCMFFLVGSTEQDNQMFEKTWIDQAGITDVTWVEQYITSLYWAVITMITIGYGDITPITVYERMFVILITLVSCGVFAYSVNQIGSLIQVLTQNSNQIQHKMGLLARHLRNRGVSQYLQMQVRKYFEYWHQEKEESEGEQCDLMIDSLSINLRQEVQTDIRNRLINQMELLKNNFSTPFLKNVSKHIKTKRSKPEEVLIEEQQINDKLYFLVQGTVTASINIMNDSITSHSPVKQLRPNSLFDQVSFMADLRCLTSYRSEGSCTLYYIFKGDFLKELKNFPLDRERYQLIKDNITIYRSQRNIGTKCTFCNKHSHSFDKCPYIKYIPYKEKHLTLYRLSIEHDRCLHHRKQYEFQVLSNVSLVKERAVNYLIDNNPYQNEEDLIERLELLNDENTIYEKSQNLPNFILSREMIEFKSSKSLLTDEASRINNNDTLNPSEINIGMVTKQQDNPSNQIYPSIPTSSKIQNGINSNNQNTTIINNTFNVFGIQPDQDQSQKYSQKLMNISLNEQSLFPNINQSGGTQNNGPLLQQQQQEKVQQSQNSQSLIPQSFQQQTFSPQISPNNADAESENTNDNTSFMASNLLIPLPPQHSNKKKPLKSGNIKLIKSSSKKKQQIEEQIENIKMKKKEQLNQFNNKSHILTPSNLKRLEEISNHSETNQEVFPYLSSNGSKREEQDKKTFYSKKTADFRKINFGNNINNNLLFLQQPNPSHVESDQNSDHPHSQSSGLNQISKSNVNNNMNAQGGSFHRPSNLNNPNFQRKNSIATTLLSNQLNLQLFPAFQENQKQEFMSLMDLDKMKVCQIYYPFGNYQNVIMRYDKMILKYEFINQPENFKFKQSVNKILQIRQLQNIILKKNHHQLKPPSLNGLKKSQTADILFKKNIS